MHKSAQMYYATEKFNWEARLGVKRRRGHNEDLMHSIYSLSKSIALEKRNLLYTHILEFITN